MSMTNKAVVMMLLALMIAQVSYAEMVIEPEKLADAIYLAEGGDKAKVAYGILSVKVKDKVEAKKVCINTINNNIPRWQWARQQGDKRDYLKFLADRYCPIGAENDNGTNKNWEKNVRRLYERGI